LSKSDKLIRLSEIAKIVRGYELEGGRVAGLIICSSEERALKSRDVWILSGKEKNLLKVRHRRLPVELKIPINAVQGTLRRYSSVSKIDVTEEFDYVITKEWNKDQFQRLQDIVGIKIPSDVLYTVRKNVGKRLGNLFIVRRLDLSAPGTKALAFYPSVDIAPTKLLWSLKLRDEYAKILTLYFNSTINLLQTLLFRAETRGAFIELSEYILNDFLVPDPPKLTLREKSILMKIFDKIKDEDLPDILYQLKHRYPPRMEVDKTFLKWLGFKGDVECALEKLYKSLAYEIETLRRLMAEGSSSSEAR
jgi:hypothetical protein